MYCIINPTNINGALHLTSTCIILLKQNTLEIHFLLNQEKKWSEIQIKRQQLLI